MAKILKEIKSADTKPVADIIKPVAEKPAPAVKPEPEKKKLTDSEKLEELYKLKEVLKQQCKEFDNSRKAKMKYTEAKAHRQKLQEMRNKVGEVREQIFELKYKISLTKKATAKISQKAVKQAKFLSLYKQGLSISNITRHPDGVKAENLEDIMTQDFIEQLDKMDRRFLPMWNRWKEKYLAKK